MFIALPPPVSITFPWARSRIRRAPSIFLWNSPMSRLDAAQLRAALEACTIGREIIVLQETTSTNDSVLQRTTAQTPEGLVVFAEHQTAGRGQRGNRWESAPAKGLWFSILLRPRIDIGSSAQLTTWVAQTVASTIHEQFSLGATVKPPNDV